MDKDFFIKTDWQTDGVIRVPTEEDFRCGASCLLCGEFVELPRSSLGIVVCENCKKLWKKLKELKR